jgi:acetyl esterase/lipase
MRHNVRDDVGDETRRNDSKDPDKEGDTSRNRLGVMPCSSDNKEESDPRISPLLAPDHTGLPPATIVVAGFDPLHDDGVKYAQNLRKAGVTVDLLDYPEMVHGFMNVGRIFPQTAEAFQRVIEIQRRYLPMQGGTPPSAMTSGDIGP